MILAATDWLSISINLLLVLFVVVCLLMVLMILMQRPKQEGLGAAFGGGMTDQMFGAQTTTVLQRGTVWCATLFFLLALTLAILISNKNSRGASLLAEQAAAEAQEEEVVDVVEVPEEEIEITREPIRSLIDEVEDESAEETPDAPEEETPDAPEEESPDATAEPEENSDPR